MLSLAKALTAGLGAALLVIVVMYVVLSDFVPSDSRAPTDETLATNFREHKQELESLLEMSKTDRSVLRIADGERGLSEERAEQYHDLFREAGVHEGILQDNQLGTPTYLICWTKGLITNGSYKGYAYSETELTPVVQSLDDVTLWPKGSKVIFKKLEGNWYLFFMST